MIASVKQLIRLDTNKIAPMLSLRNILEPTADIRNEGPAFVQKHSIIAAVLCDISFLAHKLDRFFAAEGYPPIIPIKNMSHRFLSMQHIFEITADGILNIIFESLLSVRKSDKTRNGNKEGIRDFKHIFIPLYAPSEAIFGKNKRAIAAIESVIDKSIFLRLSLIFKSRPPNRIFRYIYMHQVAIKF